LLTDTLNGKRRLLLTALLGFQHLKKVKWTSATKLLLALVATQRTHLVVGHPLLGLGAGKIEL
jgi:hypothetical protein